MRSYKIILFYHENEMGKFDDEQKLTWNYYNRLNWTDQLKCLCAGGEGNCFKEKSSY